LEETIEQEDDNISDYDQLLKRAQEARDSLQYRRAQKLARRVIFIFPNHLGALSILCSCLRSSGHAQQAIDETEGFDSANFPPLLTSRASAFCDLERWEEARKLINRAYAIGKGNESSIIASGVINRIKNARPDLYNIDDRKERRQTW
jgi:tetratricopeptide (TPR) repeat protein